MTIEEAFNQVPADYGVGLFRQDGKYQAVVTIATRAFSGPLAVVDGKDPVTTLTEAWDKAKAKIEA